LPEEKRKAIMLYYFEGMTDVEIGTLFNTSRNIFQQTDYLHGCCRF